METPGLSPNFPWSDRSCKRAQISRGTREFDISFSEDKALTIVQDVAKNEHHGPPIGVQGSVVLRQAYPDSPGPSVVIETVVNHEDLDVSVHWDATEQFLTVKVPHDTPWDDTSSRPCLSVSITVYVPESATLQTLTVSAIHLDISLLDNLSLSVLSATTLSSTVGTIVSASTGSPAHDPSLLDTNHAPSSFRFHCPSIHAHTVSAPIYVSFTPPTPTPTPKANTPPGRLAPPHPTLPHLHLRRPPHPHLPRPRFLLSRNPNSIHHLRPHRPPLAHPRRAKSHRPLPVPRLPRPHQRRAPPPPARLPRDGAIPIRRRARRAAVFQRGCVSVDERDAGRPAASGSGGGSSGGGEHGVGEREDEGGGF